jgi:hypothetical protein
VQNPNHSPLHEKHGLSSARDLLFPLSGQEPLMLQNLRNSMLDLANKKRNI